MTKLTYWLIILGGLAAFWTVTIASVLRFHIIGLVTLALFAVVIDHLYLKDLYYRKSKEIERTAYLRGVKAGKERKYRE